MRTKASNNAPIECDTSNKCAQNKLISKHIHWFSGFVDLFPFKLKFRILGSHTWPDTHKLCTHQNTEMPQRIGRYQWQNSYRKYIHISHRWPHHHSASMNLFYNFVTKFRLDFDLIFAFGAKRRKWNFISSFTCEASDSNWHFTLKSIHRIISNKFCCLSSLVCVHVYSENHGPFSLVRF